jgi:hypothetical protein
MLLLTTILAPFYVNFDYYISPFLGFFLLSLFHKDTEQNKQQKQTNKCRKPVQPLKEMNEQLK